MTFNEYKAGALTTATYPTDMADLYLDLGIHGEAGEVCDKFKKLIRDKGWQPGKDIAVNDRTDILLELGDVMWYAANIAHHKQVTLNFKPIHVAKEIDTDNSLMPIFQDDFSVNTMLKYVRSLHSEIDQGVNHLPWLVYSIAIIAQCLGSSLNQVCQMNLDKLRDRQARQALGGSGDHR